MPCIGLPCIEKSDFELTEESIRFDSYFNHALGHQTITLGGVTAPALLQYHSIRTLYCFSDRGAFGLYSPDSILDDLARPFPDAQLKCDWNAKEFVLL